MNTNYAQRKTPRFTKSQLSNIFGSVIRFYGITAKKHSGKFIHKNENDRLLKFTFESEGEFLGGKNWTLTVWADHFTSGDHVSIQFYNDDRILFHERINRPGTDALTVIEWTPYNALKGYPEVFSRIME